MPMFQKYNPAKLNPATGKMGRADQPSQLSFGRLIMVAVVVQQLWTFARRRFFKRPQPSQGDEDSEEELDSETVVQMQAAQTQTVSCLTG